MSRAVRLLAVVSWIVLLLSSAAHAQDARAERAQHDEEERLLGEAAGLRDRGQPDAALQAFVAVGNLAAERGHDDAAIAAYEAALPLTSELEWQVYLLANAAHHRLRTGDPDGAVAHLRRAVALAPRDAMLLNNLAYNLHLLGSDAESLKYYQRCLDLDPTQNIARVTLGTVARLAGRPEDALEAHEAVARAGRQGDLAPGGGEWFYAFESEVGRRSGTGATFATEPSRKALADLQVAVDLAFLDDLARAETAVQEAARRYEPNDLAPAIDKALDDVRRGLELRSGHFQLRFLAGVLLAARGDVAGARLELEAFVAAAERAHALAPRARAIAGGERAPAPATPGGR